MPPRPRAGSAIIVELSHLRALEGLLKYQMLIAGLSRPFQSSDTECFVLIRRKAWTLLWLCSQLGALLLAYVEVAVHVR